MYTLAPHTFPTPQDLQKMLGFSVGFDGFFNRLSNMDIAQSQSGYPPYNIRKLNDLQYVVELALAGFSKSDIEVEVTDGTLTIRSATAKDDGADNDEKSIIWQHLLTLCAFVNPSINAKEILKKDNSYDTLFKKHSKSNF